MLDNTFICIVTKFVVNNHSTLVVCDCRAIWSSWFSFVQVPVGDHGSSIPEVQVPVGDHFKSINGEE